MDVGVLFCMSVEKRRLLDGVTWALTLLTDAVLTNVGCVTTGRFLVGVTTDAPPILDCGDWGTDRCRGCGCCT